MPAWAKAFLRPATWKSARGGRSSGKTWAIARLLVHRAMKQPTRIFCCRDIAAAIDVSSLTVIKETIERLGVSDFFTVGRWNIRGQNGSEFHFLGLEKRRSSIKGWEGVDICWVEEAQFLTQATFDILWPTIIRNRGAELWFTWNPTLRTDPVWVRFMEQGRPTDINILVNYPMNKFLVEEAVAEIETFREVDEAYWRHIYMGEPDDVDAEHRVLSYAMAQDCVEAYKRGFCPDSAISTGIIDAGLDIADAGQDKNALVIRRGPLIESARAWRAEAPGYFAPTAARVRDYCQASGVGKLYFDGGGVGAPMRGELAKQDIGFAIESVLFGGKVKGEDILYDRRHKNKDIFMRRNAQLAFALRHRAERTIKLMRGEKDDPKLPSPEQCLFISPKIPNLTTFLAQLSMPTWRLSPGQGKREIDKRGAPINEDYKSPDLFDATCMAFSRDSRNGLRMF